MPIDLSDVDCSRVCQIVVVISVGEETSVVSRPTGEGVT